MTDPHKDDNHTEPEDNEEEFRIPFWFLILSAVSSAYLLSKIKEVLTINEGSMILNAFLALLYLMMFLMFSYPVVYQFKKDMRALFKRDKKKK